MPGAAVEVLRGIERVLHPEGGRGGRHELHETQGALRGDGFGPERGLHGDDGQHEARVEAMAASGRRGQLAQVPAARGGRRHLVDHLVGHQAAKRLRGHPDLAPVLQREKHEALLDAVSRDLEGLAVREDGDVRAHRSSRGDQDREEEDGDPSHFRGRRSGWGRTAPLLRWWVWAD